MRSCYAVRSVALVGFVLAATAGNAPALVNPPPQRALELPPGATSIAAADPLVAAILNGATSTLGGHVACTAPAVFNVGKTLVTWTDSADASTLSEYVYVYPNGYQVIGTADNLRIFEHNGGRHLLYDRDNRVHAIYSDGSGVWYRLGVRWGRRVQWRDPVQVNSSTTPIAWSSLGTRGETFTLSYDPTGKVNVQCTWSTIWPYNRSILTRRLTVDPVGNVSVGDIVYTGLTGSFQSIAADSTGRLHLAVEVYSAMAYAYSDDGVTWTAAQTWYATQTNCTAYRFPNVVIDSKDRVHLLWQAEGYLGNSGSRDWWVGLYAMFTPQSGTWTTPVNVLSGLADWSAPASGQQILFAYPNLLLDDRNNLHLSWHGTARSHIYAWDDTYYQEKVYNAATDTWGAWTNYAILHARDHFNTGNGEDMNYTWVPSQAYKPGTGDLYAVIMFGLGDDEVDDPTVNLTDGMLKTRIGGTWQAGFQNVTNTPDQRSWYPNVPPRVQVDPNGHSWLDMIWVDGTKDDYNVVFRRLDLGGGLAGDCDGDGHVDVIDLLIFIDSFGKSAGEIGYNYACDFDCDTTVDVFDLIDLVRNFGT